MKRYRLKQMEVKARDFLGIGKVSHYCNITLPNKSIITISEELFKTFFEEIPETEEKPAPKVRYVCESVLFYQIDFFLKNNPNYKPLFQVQHQTVDPVYVSIMFEVTE